MHKLLLAALLTIAFAANAAFPKDTAFISYDEFARLSKNEIKQRYGKDEESRRIIDHYYKYNRRPLKKLWGIIPLTAIGTYFAILSANASNGMASTVGLVLAILFLLPASILLISLLRSLVSGEKRRSKRRLYEELNQYFQSR